MAGGFRGLMNKVNLSSNIEEEQYEDADSYEPYDYEETDSYGTSSSVVPMRVAQPAADLSRIVTVRPLKYADAEMLAMPDSLKQNIPVIAHIGNMNENDQRAFLYFMSGVSYALDAHTEHVAAHVFLISPKEVSVMDSSGNVLSNEDS
ncbi:cell division protein SepF [Actinomycetaceae bacterium TAE3-ERU4]|nr:cell division protein SepF [Actinomycetaceae bacterium TAE3-ERU4]